jgi:hypothetical protein
MKNPPSISNVAGLRMDHSATVLSGGHQSHVVQQDTPTTNNSTSTSSSTLAFLENGQQSEVPLRAKFPPGCPVVYLSSPSSITSGKVLSSTYSKSSNEHIYTILPAGTKQNASSIESALNAATVPQSSIHFHPSCPIRIDLSKASSLVMLDAAVMSKGESGAKLLLLEKSTSEILAGYARMAAIIGTDDNEDTDAGDEEGEGPKTGMQWAYSIRITLQSGRIVTYHGVDESLLCHDNSSIGPNNDDGANESTMLTQDSTNVTEEPCRHVAPKVVPLGAYASKSAIESFERAKIAHVRRIDIPSELVTPQYNLIWLAKRYLDQQQGRHLVDLIRDLERRVLCRVFLYDQAAKKQSAQHVAALCGDLRPTRHDDVCVFLRARDAPTADWGADTMVRILADAFGRDSDDVRYLQHKMLTSVAGTTMADSRYNEIPPSLGAKDSGSADGQPSNLSGSVRSYDDAHASTQSNKRSKKDCSYPAGSVHIGRIEIPYDLSGKALRTAILGSNYSINTIESDLKCRITFFHDRKKNIRWDEMTKSFGALCPTIGDLCLLVRSRSPSLVENACDVMIQKIVDDLGRRRRCNKDLERELVCSTRTATVMDDGFTEPTYSARALISRIDLPDWLDTTEMANRLIGPRGLCVSRLMKVSNCSIKVKGQGVRSVCGNPNADTLYITFEGDTEEKMAMAYELVQDELLRHIGREQHERLLYDLEANCHGYRTASLIPEGGPTVYQSSHQNGRQPCWMNVVSIPWQSAEEIKDYLKTRYIGMGEESGCSIDIFGVGEGGKYKYYPYLLVTGQSESEVDHGVALVRASIENF